LHAVFRIDESKVNVVENANLLLQLSSLPSEIM